MQCFQVTYTFYLHYFTFLTTTFETYNNIDLKTKPLFTLMKSFEILNFVTKIFFSSITEEWGEGSVIFFEKKISWGGGC